jgi:hypothetical protein
MLNTEAGYLARFLPFLERRVEQRGCAIRASAFVCCYCAQLLDEDDDGQRSSKREVAHTACAFAADAACFAELDAEKFVDVSKDDDH